MKPRIEPLTDPRGWRYEWGDVGIQMDVCPIGHGRDGGQAEITVRALDREVWGHMHGPVTYDLEQTRTRQGLGRYLRTRARRSGVDWEGMVEQACALTLRALRGVPEARGGLRRACSGKGPRHGRPDRGYGRQAAYEVEPHGGTEEDSAHPRPGTAGGAP